MMPPLLLPIQYHQIAVPSVQYSAEKALRDKVLREPLGLSLSQEDLANEEHQMHIGAFEKEQLIGCVVASKIDDKVDTFRIRQMAVMDSYQGHGIGKKLILKIEDIIKQHEGKYIILDARVSAQTFYSKLNYVAASDEFMNKGIPHVLMQKNI